MSDGESERDGVPVDAIDDLAGRIDDTRLEYITGCHGGIHIQGNPFIVTFDEPVDPEAFCKTVSTPSEPWQTFGVNTELADDYRKLQAVLLHVADDGEADDASEATLEVAPEWARIYVKEDASAERVAELVRLLDDEYGVEVSFADD